MTPALQRFAATRLQRGQTTAGYLALGAAVFAWAMRDARNRGTLLQMGE